MTRLDYSIIFNWANMHDYAMPLSKPVTMSLTFGCDAYAWYTLIKLSVIRFRIFVPLLSDPNNNNVLKC